MSLSNPGPINSERRGNSATRTAQTRLIAGFLACGLVLSNCDGTDASPQTVVKVVTVTAVPATTTETSYVAHDFSGGCSKFGVYAQDRWSPLGAAVRQAPDVLAAKLGGFAGNEVIAVKGWVHTDKPAYPTNIAPWNDDVWYRLADTDGWVSFAGVRGEPTIPDPTGRADGGLPAPLNLACEGKYLP